MAGKCLTIILDGVGCGELPDAALYADSGSNTLANLAKNVGDLDLPNLAQMGLGNIVDIPGIPPASKPTASHGKMAEISPAKDSTAGHWELMGLPLDKPFPLYPEGFPPALVHKLEVATGSKFIGNIPASGTEIIAELGEEHIRSGALILYTSADSVLQIAAHEQVVPVAELYQICRIIRGIMTGENAVARVIARPFIGEPGAFIRTANRHDFSLEPPDQTVLDLLEEAGITTIGIGKIYDLFGGKGIKVSIPTRSNSEGIKKTIEITSSTKNAFIFTNLVDFDMLWGHRNDPEGFYSGLREFDLHLPRILESLKIGDLLILTADHGVDPTTPSTDHSREYVPLLVWKPELNSGVNLGTRETFADVGASVADFFQIEGTWWGISFLPELYA